MSTAPFPIVILISGNGSNLQAIIDAINSGHCRARIAAVISNRPDAYGLQRARQAGIETAVIDHTRYDSRSDFDQALLTCIDQYAPGLVVLAGFMRVLTPAFVNHFHGRLINIHPSLLPAFTGLDTHQRALDAGVDRHGASVHFVSDELDGGPVISQAQVTVNRNDSRKTLAARVLEQEHRLLPYTIDLISTGRIVLRGNEIVFDQHVLTRPLDCTNAGLPAQAQHS